MKNYPFSFDTLCQFSNSTPYLNFTSDQKNLFELLNSLREKYNFPAVTNDIGSLLQFLISLHKPKTIFEMGSGYGHSAFWYSLNENFVEKIILTEIRDDLITEFENLPWPVNFKSKIEYFNQDAFELIKGITNIDFLLIDGVKANYKNFLEESYSSLSPEALVVIDNSYWRGSFLDDEMLKHKSANGIKELHEYISKTNLYEGVFIPFQDGLTLLRKVSA